LAGTFDRVLAEACQPGLTGLALDLTLPKPGPRESVACFHCGEPCPDTRYQQAEKTFCCHGCLTVHDLLTESGLGQFYDLSRAPGVRIRAAASRDQWAYLDEPALQQRLLDFTDGKLSRITFHIPAIHCVACVWLLENLFRLHPGVGRSQVNFPRREVAIGFVPAKITLGALVALLVSIGYQPQLTLGELEKRAPNPAGKRQWLQLGIAGFAFGNIMLFSIPSYLGLDSLTAGPFRVLFGWLSLALAAPVLVYSAADYWRSAFLSLRQRVLTLDVPIALGLAALYAQSALEILSGRGEGYLDSLAGLVFFLLCGRTFQHKAYDRMAFDLDYKCYFPLSVRRVQGEMEESVAISDLRVGDRLRLRHSELIPADALLVNGAALIDYSFVTGESEPVARQAGDYVYAGGQQVGSTIEVETVKPVSQSYLTSLWNHETFQKTREDDLNTLTNRYSRRFTRIVIAVALGAALFWIAAGNSARGLKAFTSVLIVACPCALALAAPFALGTAQRLLAHAKVFLKNALVLERLAQVNAVVFDKTGTLTAVHDHQVNFHPAEGAEPMSELERSWLHRLTQHSTHPHAARIAHWSREGGPGTPGSGRRRPAVGEFSETPGYGLAGSVDLHDLRLGSQGWLATGRVTVPELDLPAGSLSCLAIDGQFRGAFVLTNALREETDQLLSALGRNHELALLSGDNERERDRFRALFGAEARMHFNQSPIDKLGFIRELQTSGKRVMMVGDGLNDAGALKQSDIGVAVVEKVGSFSPASDIILEAGQVPRLSAILNLARRSTRIVRLSFGISAVYNLLGISIAAAGVLSPLLCAVLMPLSSISVVLFACGMTRLAARKEGVQ
jgi:P-type Cu+ transporter